MDKSFGIVAVIFAGLLTSPAQADPKERAYGVWMETYRTFAYMVDTEAELCFVAGKDAVPIAEVDCRALYRRNEWKSVLRWLDPDGGSRGWSGR